jgi:hypothetical protein
LLEKGKIRGKQADLIREHDIKWNRPTAAKAPSRATITKRANGLLKRDRAKLEAEVLETYSYSFADERNLSPAERKEQLDDYVKDLAREKAGEYYDDHTNPKNTVSVSIDHPLLNGTIEGNDKNGYRLNYESETVENNRHDLEAKNLEDAKKEAIQKMVAAGDVTPASADTSPDEVNKITGPTKWHKYVVPGGENYREVLLTLPNLGSEDFQYRTHFDEKNILAHVRLTDRVDAQGRKTLFIEEMQSDWHQQGREKGYKGQPNPVAVKELLDGQNPEFKIEEKDGQWVAVAKDDGMKDVDTISDSAEKAAQKFIDKHSDGVPNAPYKNTDAWAGLALKRMIRMAAEQGYEALAWSPAEVHVDRWGTDNVSWVKREGLDTSSWSVQKTKDGSYAVMKPREGALKEHSPNEMMGDFATEENAQRFIEEKSKPHFLVGSAEQRGGNADGVNIEELARMRGELLERRGERVTNKEELQKVVAETLGRERDDRSLQALTDRVWKQMQGENEHTGAIEPRKEGMDFFYNKLIPDVAKKLLKKLDPDTKIEVGAIGTDGFNKHGTDQGEVDPEAGIKDDSGGLKALEIPLSDKLKEKVLNEGFSLFQDGNDGPRGQIKIGDGGIDITLLKNADSSTFFHETGHFYLEVLHSLAERSDSPQQIKDDLGIIRQWVGAEEGKPFSIEQHEAFARGFEAYLMEGKAPTQELRSAFARFKVWLISVYRQMTNLNINLSPEVRGVMDRLLATDEEIARAQKEQGIEPIFGDPEAVGLRGEKLDRYLRARDEARQAAEEELTQKAMADFTREKESWWKKQHSKVKSEIEDQVNQQRIYRAISILGKGKLPDGSELPEGMEELKLSRKALTEQYGKEFLKKLPRPYVYSAEGGLHPDVAAGMLGFESGDDLVSQLANARKKDDLVKELADAKMKELHPSLVDGPDFPQEAMKALHNEKQAQVMRLELEHIMSNDMPTFKEVARLATRKPPTQKAMREKATAIVAQRKVSDLSPYLFQRAEAKAAKEAGIALAKGDFDGLVEAKTRQLLNHELYRSATKAQEEVDGAFEDFKKISKSDEKLAKTRDLDLVNAARAILANYGLGKSDQPAESYLEQIQRYDPETYQTVKALVGSVQENAGYYKTVSFDNFLSMTDTVRALWDLARSTRQIEIDGQAVDREKVIDDLTTVMSNFGGGGKPPGYEKAVSKWDKSKLLLMGVKSSLRRVESWVDAMDSGNINGEFRRYIWNPVSEGINNYREAKKGVLSKFLEIVKPIEDSLTKKEIRAPELGYTFSSKQELLGALLHTGNDSNLSKLLRGRSWGEFDENGNLDTSRWDSFVRRMISEGTLTKADYDFAQATWNLLEEMKPQAQKVHKRLYGHYFNEITAQEIHTPFGDYRGGYVPAIADPFIAQDAAIREEKASLEGLNNSFMFPTAGRGFTKARTEMYAKPLALDLRFVPSHIDKVMRFIHIEPHVKEVGRLVMDRSFRETLDKVDTAAGGDMLVPWLQRAALQKVETPSSGWGGRAADTFWRAVRRQTSLQIMTANVTSAMHQFTGISTALLKVEPGHMRDALWNYVRAPKDTAEAVAEKSTFMRNMTTQTAHEIMATVDDLLLNPNKYEELRSFMKQHAQFLQHGAQNIVSVVTWSGAYDQAVAQGMNELEAVRSADSAVRQTQHSFAPEDVSRFETGSPFVRAFTMFYTYFNVQSNLMGTEALKTIRETGLKKGAGRLLYIYTMGMMIPAMMSEEIHRAMAGKSFPGTSDDEDTLTDVMAFFFGSQQRALTAMLPGVGQVINSGINYALGGRSNGYDDRISTSPAISLIESAASAPKSAYEAITADGSRKKAIRDTMTFLGLMTGMPLAPLAKPLGYLSDVDEGKTDPTGPIDFARGLVSGKSGE